MSFDQGSLQADNPLEEDFNINNLDKIHLQNYKLL